MDRRRRRLIKRLKARIGNATGDTEPLKSASHVARTESLLPQSVERQSFRQTISRTKVLWSLLSTILALVGYYALFRSNVSVDPDRLLNPGDPFSTLFSVKNDSSVFDVKGFHPACYTIYVVTDHNFGMNGLFPRPAPTISVIEPQQKTTIDCPSWVGGLGAGAGNVVKAFIEIDVSYRQDWWPVSITRRFPFKGVVDSNKAVYWTHITPAEIQTALSPKAK